MGDYGMARIAILVYDRVEDDEFTYPLYYFKWKGHDVIVASPLEEFGSKYGCRKWKADLKTSEIEPSKLDACIIPGGYSPDKLRLDGSTLNLVRELIRAGKVVAAICHGPQVLISANVVKGRRLTSAKQVRDDLINAGAEWVDEAVVVDGNLITSRYPRDLPGFVEAIERALSH